MAEPDARVASDSLAVAGWTAVSRVTGFLRVAVIAAVLGPTYLGNTFVAANLLPTIAFQFLAGALVATLLVPALVGKLDRDGRTAAERLASGFMGVAVLVLAAVAAIVVALGPVVLALLAVAVPQGGVAEEQLRTGWLLLALLMPQVPLYGAAAIAAAAMNARGRFALSAAAPAAENAGVIATMGATALLFGTGTPIEEVGTAQLLVMGLGTTGAVALHAALQWWGAHRAGIRLRPRVGWRDADVAVLIRRARLSVGQSSLDAVRLFAALVAANAVPGGVVALGLALNFFYLPLALGARPVAVAYLPRLARLRAAATLVVFRDEYIRGTAAALFLAVPAAVGYLLLAEPLAQAAAFGEMAASDGIALTAIALAALAPGIAGEAWFLVAVNASYALDDARSPLRAAAARAAVTLSGLVAAVVLLDGRGVLAAAGAALSAGSLVAAWQLGARLRARLPAGRERLGPPLIRALAASLVMAVPAYAVAAAAPALVGGHVGHVAAAILACVVGTAAFIGLQHRWESPELAFFVAGARGSRRWGTP